MPLFLSFSGRLRLEDSRILQQLVTAGIAAAARRSANSNLDGLFNHSANLNVDFTLFRLADSCGLLRDPELAVERMQTLLAMYGVRA